MVWDSIPIQLAKENKKFFFGQIKKGARSSEFKGALSEQYVLQQLISDTEYTPYYYGTEKATFEQDFLIQKGKNIIPIEVKAETNIHSQSLRAYCDKYHPERAVRFSALKYMNQEWMQNRNLNFCGTPVRYSVEEASSSSGLILRFCIQSQYRLIV